MAVISTYAIRRAKTRRARLSGKRWIAQAEFPGGRAIIYGRARNRPVAVQKIRVAIRQNVASAANAGAITVDNPNDTTAGGGYGDDPFTYGPGGKKFNRVTE